ncbi:energy-coupling factor transporter transmembrane component T [Anaerosphaera multitolerans]|uniref:Energy-coupling factor transporter transmembrane protein EcfT n=1 Tax=Anaerosphaera multitolerans TaxID=2487351 RepID=A0A437S5Z7_9FIRM|nr:energy-coupling factor transporter transmembrane component T [Anaerosphaera multitolerans]RVU54440.1 energy-coupling factor transporter transmembrane protein EcfT [Anaerosphaera multitolerans]
MESLKLKKDSFVYIHPITKIIIFFSCTFIMMSSGERLVENLIILFLLFLLLNAKFYNFFAKGFFFICILIVIEFFIIFFKMPVILLSIIKFIKMFIPSVISYYLLAQGTTSLEIMTGLNSIKFPRSIMIPLVVMIRFIPTVVESIRETGKALKIKGFTKNEIIKKPIESSELVLVPVLMSCLNSMDELAAASIARGFSLNTQRTYILDLHYSIFDLLVILFLISMIFLSRWL